MEVSSAGELSIAPLDWNPGYSALDEEFREVFESVTEAAQRPGLDEDRSAACAFLLRHLASAGKWRDMM